MTKLFLSLFLIFSTKIICGQSYETETIKAAAYYDQKKFDSCAVSFMNAFKLKGASGADLYNAAVCNTLSFRSRQAFELLNNAITRGINISKMRIDPELDFLHDKKGWKKLMKEASRIQKDSFARVQYPTYAAALSQLWEADQYYRFRLGHAYDNNDTVLANSLWQKMRSSDSLNLSRFEAIMAVIGWPTITKVGKRGAATAFLIIDHTPKDVMEKYFPLLEEAAKNGETSLQDYATIKDRVEVNRNGHQIYGTQKYWDAKIGKFVFFPIADEKKVNALRKEVGLEPLQEFGE